MQGFSAAKVLVVGDLMLDDYWEGEAQRISPEAPVPVVHVKKEYSKAGGKSRKTGGKPRLTFHEALGVDLEE